MSLAIDGANGSPVAFSDYVGDVTLTNSFGEQDVTPLSKFAMDRLQLTEDTTMSITGQGFPDDTIMDCITVTPRLPVDGRDVTITYPGGWTYVFKAMIFSFAPARPQNGGITWSLEMRLTGGTAGVWADGT
jgi:hypothetical protein